jgi:hypothetical protein
MAMNRLFGSTSAELDLVLQKLDIKSIGRLRRVRKFLWYYLPMQALYGPDYYSPGQQGVYTGWSRAFMLQRLPSSDVTAVLFEACSPDASIRDIHIALSAVSVAQDPMYEVYPDLIHSRSVVPVA